MTTKPVDANKKRNQGLLEPEQQGQEETGESLRVRQGPPSVDPHAEEGGRVRLLGGRGDRDPPAGLSRGRPCRQEVFQGGG